MFISPTCVCFMFEVLIHVNLCSSLRRQRGMKLVHIPACLTASERGFPVRKSSSELYVNSVYIYPLMWPHTDDALTGENEFLCGRQKKLQLHFFVPNKHLQNFNIRKQSDSVIHQQRDEKRSLGLCTQRSLGYFCISNSVFKMCISGQNTTE